MLRASAHPAAEKAVSSTSEPRRRSFLAPFCTCASSEALKMRVAESAKADAWPEACDARHARGSGP